MLLAPLRPMSLRRRRVKRDTTPCVVVVAPHTLVFWDGRQRSGTVHGVPKYLAMMWLRYKWVTSVAEPVGSGAASTAGTSRPQAAAMTGKSLPESDELRGATPTTFADDAGESLLADDGDETALPGAGDKTTGPRRPHVPDPSPAHASQPGRSVNSGPYASQGIAPEVSQRPPETIADLREHPDSPPDEPVRDGETTRTQAPANPYGPGRCPNCGTPTTGRRKWCDDACRLQAYRRSRRV